MNELKKRLKDEIVSLCGTPSVSGFETRATEALHDMLGASFDEERCDAVGNHIFIRRCGADGAPLALIDTHFDEIGMIVTEICEGGFLKFGQVGGLSLAVLQAADVIVWGERQIRGVITSTPPHLRPSDSDKLAELDELMIDTGFSKEELERIVSVGTPVGFAPRYTELLGDTVAGKSFDNKACVAIAAAAVSDVPREELACDVALVLSCFEETSRLGGAAPAAFALKPDYAMVIDVNLATVPDVPRYETVPLGKGVSISVSAATDRALTLETRTLCEAQNIAHTMIAAPSSTGTNAPTVNLTGSGIPTVDVGLPLKNMHTYNEVISLDDAVSLYSLVRSFISSERIASRFRRREEELPL